MRVNDTALHDRRAANVSVLHRMRVDCSRAEVISDYATSPTWLVSDQWRAYVTQDSFDSIAVSKYTGNRKSLLTMVAQRYRCFYSMYEAYVYSAPNFVNAHAYAKVYWNQS